MSIKLYVGNVPTSARNSELKELFEKFGKVIECDILKEFAFVHMESDNDAKAAIAGLNDSLWKGSRIRVELSTTKTQKGEPARRDYKNGGRGGFNNRGGRGGGFNNRDYNGRGGGFRDNRNGYNDRGDRNGRGGFNDRNRGRSNFNNDKGDSRTMSRGGYGDRFSGPQRRDNGGGGPIREPRFNGGGNYSRPYPDQYNGGGGSRNPPPPMNRDFNGEGYSMRPPMPPANGNYNNNGPQDYYNGHCSAPNGNMNGFNGNGFNGGPDSYNRPPMNQQSMPPMSQMNGHNGGPPNDYYNHLPHGGPPKNGQRFNNFENNNGNFNNGPMRGQRFNNY